MKRILLTALILVSFAHTSHASEAAAPVAGFFARLAGSWSGSGKVTMYIGVRGTFPFSATLDSHVLSPDSWEVLNVISGSHGGGSNDNTYSWDGKQLSFSGQFSAPVKIDTASETEFSFELSHVDGNTGSRVLMKRTMQLTDANTMSVVADVYQNGSLVEHFVYTLSRR